MKLEIPFVTRHIPLIEREFYVCNPMVGFKFDDQVIFGLPNVRNTKCWSIINFLYLTAEEFYSANYAKNV